MEFEGNKSPSVQELYNMCKKMMYYHATLRMQDGTEIDGIIIGLDPEHVDLLVGEDVIYREDENKNNEQRQYVNPRRPRRVRRFRRRRIPLPELLLLSLLPYPYYVPPYPYYPPYPGYTDYTY